ncbi:hypothetical protein BC830DRAFT_1204122 [Chytriomyces sp. MP71]|nr:hypothetical protein BC830DRAFT_1204122 [Chytriomyces sp. MP71]
MSDKFQASRPTRTYGGKPTKQLRTIAGTPDICDMFHSQSASGSLSAKHVPASTSAPVIPQPLQQLQPPENIFSPSMKTPRDAISETNSAVSSSFVPASQYCQSKHINHSGSVLQNLLTVDKEAEDLRSYVPNITIPNVMLEFDKMREYNSDSEYSYEEDNEQVEEDFLTQMSVLEDHDERNEDTMETVVPDLFCGVAQTNWDTRILSNFRTPDVELLWTGKFSGAIQNVKGKLYYQGHCARVCQKIEVNDDPVTGNPAKSRDCDIEGTKLSVMYGNQKGNSKVQKGENCQLWKDLDDMAGIHHSVAPVTLDRIWDLDGWYSTSDTTVISEQVNMPNALS